MIEYICVTKAAYLLGICRQRVQQLLYEGRVEGAFKDGRFWKIPLNEHDMPEIIPGTRGPKGDWRKRLQRTTTYIHVNQHRIRDNSNKEDKDPVICVRRGDDVTYCHQVDLLGGLCRVVYSPERCKPCGAKVWIEIDPIIDPVIAAKICQLPPVVTKNFAVSSA